MSDEKPDEPLLERVWFSYATKADVENDGLSLVTRRGSFRRCNLAELVAWCAARGQSPADVEVSGGSISFRESETAEERQRRLDHGARARERHERWERETCERLAAKFGAS